MAEPITKLQLVALQTLWAKKMRLAGIDPASDDSRSMRHEYIRTATAGRAAQTKELNRVDARRVMDLIAADAGERRALRIRDREAAHDAGNHGRRDYHGGALRLIGDGDRELLRRLQAAVGWDQARLDAFIARQLAGRQMRTVADLNKVVWPLKRMARVKRA